MALVTARGCAGRSWGRDNLSHRRRTRNSCVTTPTIFRRRGFGSISKCPTTSISQSELELIPPSITHVDAAGQGRRRGTRPRGGPSGGSLKGKMKEGVAFR